MGIRQTFARNGHVACLIVMGLAVLGLALLLLTKGDANESIQTLYVGKYLGHCVHYDGYKIRGNETILLFAVYEHGMIEAKVGDTLVLNGIQFHIDSFNDGIVIISNVII